MYGKFFWITDKYRININCIFSLEDKETNNTNDYRDWIASYEECLDNIKSDEEILKTIISDLKDDSQSVVEEALNKYIYSKIGEPPEESIHEYSVILTNGVRVKISKYKYDKINELIDKYCI